MKYEGDSKILAGMSIIGGTVVGIVKPIVVGTVILGLFNPVLTYAIWATALTRTKYDDVKR